MLGSLVCYARPTPFVDKGALVPLPLFLRDKRSRVAGEAAHWLAQELSGTIDRPAFEAWRAADPAHAIAFARALAGWRRAGQLVGVTAPLHRSRRQALAMFAGLGLTTVLAGTGLATRAFAWDGASSALGQCRRIALPDGSLAVLNTDTRLEWDFSASARGLRIVRGEVALTLKTGARARIEGEGHWASLARGSYNVRLHGGAMDITVFQGTAQQITTTEPHNRAGNPVARAQQGLLLSDTAPAVRDTDSPQIAALRSWQSGEIVFTNEPLALAVEEYNRYLTRKIVIADPQVAAISVGGRFLSRDPAAFLEALELGFGIRVSPSGEGYVLTRGKKSPG